MESSIRDWDVLFLSKLIPKELEEEIGIKSYNNMQDAANGLQWKIVSGLDSNLQNPIILYNILPIGSYPGSFTDCIIRTKQFKHHPKAKDKNLGFLNLAYIKQFTQGYFVKKHIKNWSKRNNGLQKVLLAYTLDRGFLATIKLAKRINPNIITCAIVADLPAFTNLASDSKKLLTIYTKYNVHKITKYLSCIDSFVLLTKQMSDYLGIDKPYVVMEGIATEDMIKNNSNDKHKNIKTIFYAGTLHKKFGIVNLLDSFSLIPKENYRLIICGIGDSVETVKTKAVIDKRIQYLGQLRQKEVLKIMQEATVLVNPRQNNNIFTKFSFPSKNLECLSSGVPLVAYKLDGIPDEYDEFIEYVKGDSVEDLKSKLMEVCEMSTKDLFEKGHKAREFVLKQKSSQRQGEKIVKLIESQIV